MATRTRTGGAKRWSWVIALVVIAGLIIADRNGWLLAPAGDDVSEYDGVQVRVARVIDGDTVDVALPDPLQGTPRTRVRVWGIDCPETAGSGREAEPFADEATAATRRLADGELVTLRLEPHRTRGGYGRLLAHVELEDGRLLAEILIDEGLAFADDRWSHAHLAAFEDAERRARTARRRLWESR